MQKLHFASCRCLTELHSTGAPLLLAFTPALLMCSHGSFSQFLKSCSMAIWRTCSSEAKVSFSCTAVVSSSNTSVKKGQDVFLFTHKVNLPTNNWGEKAAKINYTSCIKIKDTYEHKKSWQNYPNTMSWSRETSFRKQMDMKTLKTSENWR